MQYFLLLLSQDFVQNMFSVLLHHLPMKAGALQGSMSISADCFFGMTRFNNSSTLNGDSYLLPERILDSTGGPVPAAHMDNMLYLIF